MTAEAPDPWQRVALAYALLAVDPAGLGGVVLQARAGPARDAALAALPALSALPRRRLPPNADDAALFGGLDLAASLSQGRLIRAPGLLDRPAALVLPMAERCPPALAGRLAAALDAPEPRCLIALDESAGPEEALPPALSGRLAFHLNLDGLRPAPIAPPDPALTAAARTRLAQVRCDPATIRALAEAALILGISCLRAPLFALRAARAHAALAGREAIAPADLDAAAQLVLAPRATQLPQDSEPQPPDPPETAEPPPPSESAAPPEADILVEAVRAVLPEGLLPTAQGQPRTSASAGRGDGQKRVLPSRGRPLPPRRRRPDGRSRIDIVATLRSAAPWQRLRGAEPGSPAIRASDICLKRFEERSARLLIFVVDASGSAAHARLNEAKGAVELLLARAYARRDQVALIGFRNREAGLLLPPSRSLVQAKRRLAALPGGGATPLAHGLKSAGMLACQAQGQGLAPTLVLLSDGRANVALDGSIGRAQASADSDSTADWLRAEGIGGLVLDTGLRPQPALRDLAARMGARHLPLPRADSAGMSRAISAAMDG